MLIALFRRKEVVCVYVWVCAWSVVQYRVSNVVLISRAVRQDLIIKLGVLT